MQTVITVKLPEGLKKAIQKIASKKFMSMSGYIKAACEKALLDDGIQWREESKKLPKKPKSPHP